MAHCYQALREADGRGDFSHAVQAAEDCLAFLGRTTQTDPSKTRNGYYATYYLASALRKGKGVPIDELRAFDLLKSLADVDLDGDAALDLAEMYLNGNGTTRDPVEAAVLVWRVAHGAWSFYSPYWGMCNNCDDLWKHRETLEHRLDRELTRGEREQARMREIDKFPDILARANHRDRQVSIATACVIFTIVAAIWWRTRPSKRSAVRRIRA